MFNGNIILNGWLIFDGFMRFGKWWDGVVLTQTFQRIPVAEATKVTTNSWAWHSQVFFLTQNSWGSLKIREKHGSETIPAWWLSPTPLKNMSSSVGMMTFPIYEKKTCSKPPTSIHIHWLILLSFPLRKLAVRAWPTSNLIINRQGVVAGY